MVSETNAGNIMGRQVTNEEILHKENVDRKLLNDIVSSSRSYGEPGCDRFHRRKSDEILKVCYILC